MRGEKYNTEYQTLWKGLRSSRDKKDEDNCVSHENRNGGQIKLRITSCGGWNRRQGTINQGSKGKVWDVPIKCKTTRERGELRGRKGWRLRTHKGNSKGSSADHQGRRNTCLTLHPAPKDSLPEAKQKRLKTQHELVNREFDTRKMKTTEVSSAQWLPEYTTASPEKVTSHAVT